MCAPCGRVWREEGREVVKVVSGRVRMAGMTERETKTEGGRAGVPYTTVRGKTLLHDDWSAKAASKVQGTMRWMDGYSTDTMHGTCAVGSGHGRLTFSGFCGSLVVAAGRKFRLCSERP